MRRVPEPEVMDEATQALAYARADFADVNQGFVRGLLDRYPELATARLIDLGCGPADIPLRLATAAPGAFVVGVDASLPMLRLAREAIGQSLAGGRVRILCAYLPALPVADGDFDAVVSNSLLHHLPEPGLLWRAARALGRPGGVLHVMDLFRPESEAQARAIVEAAAGDAHPILKEDFFRSLLAAFTPDEVRAQLAPAGLGHLTCDVVSERHWLVSGRLPAADAP